MRGRRGELHWTTQDEDVIHLGRIGGGGLGDVHRVLLGQVFLTIDV